ncbi:MAG: VanZ family protein [Clostridia bacterium]|nr:VanZ family protein [Clostridia bacterium]
MIKAAFEKLKKLPLGEWILIALMLITVLSFFIQSALPPEVSSAESDAVSDAIEPVIPSDTEVGEVVHENIRKIGHFVEFAILGIEAAVFLFFYTKSRAADFLCCTSSALFIGLLDESVQMFSGRGPAVSDVWLDFSGFAVFFAITYSVIFLFSRIWKKRTGKVD